MDAAALDRFARLVAASGFRREAILPGYGLAEATLACPEAALASFRCWWPSIRTL